MIMLACDLDNTMIYGKAENEKDYFPVEYIGGTVVTWISRKALAMLESLDKRIALVPVTARSIEEYRRIRIFERIVPPYAITSMGGVILKNGEIDKDWRGSREKTADPLKEKIERLYNKLKTNVHVSLMKIIDDVYLFIKSNETESILGEITNDDEAHLFDVMRRKEKIYVVPKYINKGAAVIKIYASLGARCLVAAGDSEADISMLTRADYALIPSEKHADRLHAAPAHVIIKPEGIDFASFILCFSSKLLKS